MAEVTLRTLDDETILSIARKITDLGMLQKLAYKGLKLEHHQIESTITNNKNNIHAISHELLKIWFIKQAGRKQAFDNLHEALKKCKLQMLVDELIKETDKSIPKNLQQESYNMPMFINCPRK